MMAKNCFRLIVLLACAQLVFSVTVTAQDMSAHDILERMEDTERASRNSALVRMQLSSCKYGVRDSKITCAERPRVKALESVGKGYGENLRDSRSVIITLEPASERGISMLSFSYDDSSRDNESWLYLSALGRVKRLASGSDDDETEPGSLFGSEFTTEDQQTGKLDEYELKILDTTTIDGREVWKIERIPNSERALKSRYSRSVAYIDKERFVMLRAEMYDQYGKEIKRMLSSRVELVNGVWVARSTTMMNLVTNRLSNMAFLEIHTGIEVPDEFLTQRTLTDTAYRETELAKLRAQLD